MSETRSLKPQKEGAKPDGELRIIRPSELAKSGTTGTVAEGVLESKKPNKFNPGNMDYFIRSDDGSLTIINETSSLKEQLGQDGVVGMRVRVDYNGKKPTKSGKTFHDFSCFEVKSK